MSALSQYQAALENHPARGSGLNVHCMRVARLGVLAELDPQTIIKEMNEKLKGIKPEEAPRAVSTALNTKVVEKAPPVKPNRFKPKAEKALDNFISDMPREEMELIAASPIRLLNDPDKDGKVLLKALYEPDEWLFIGDVYDKTVKPVKDWLQYGHDYPHIIPNPMTGEWGETTDGKESRRCEETVADLRYAVCEMDDVPLDKQVAFWLKCISIKVPVAAIIHSGKKSLHGWVRVDCGTDTEKWDRDVKGWLFNEFGVQYGLDKACATKARLSRMAGHHRKGAEQQKLLYLEAK